MDIDFYSKYIKYNFDQIFIENNNQHVMNSESVYSNFKREYMDETIKAYEQFKDYTQQLEQLNGTPEYQNTGNRHIFVYKNTKEIARLQQAIKDIYVQQEIRFNNFHHYVTLLNKQSEKYLSKQTEKRSFLSKLFDKK